MWTVYQIPGVANNISLGLPVMNALGNDLKKLLYPGGAAGDQATIIDVAAKIRVSYKFVHALPPRYLDEMSCKVLIR